MEVEDIDADRRSNKSFLSKLSFRRTPSNSRSPSDYGFTARNDDDDLVRGRPKGTTSTVEISVSCRNLEDRDTFSKSDPMCVCYNRPPGSKVWVECMRTEMIENDLDPDFAAKIMMDYYFDKTQPLRFEVYDMDGPNCKVSPEDSLGYVDLTLGQIVQSSGTGLTIELSGQKNVNDTDKPPASIILICEELPAEKDEVNLKLGGRDIGVFEFGCVPPKVTYVISKMTTNDSGLYLVVHRSRSCRGQNPTWENLRISCRSLCNGELDRVLKIDVYQKTFAGTLILCGTTLTNLTNLMSQKAKERIELMSSTGDTCKSSLRVVSCAMTPINTFIDYLKSGMHIHCCFSIDFTCSNGHPTDPQSLHYICPQSKNTNVYQQAIQAVGNILQDYDTSMLFPTYGFGARLPPYGEISHDFHINFSDSPNCISIAGVLEAYKECMNKIQLYGPTYFAPVIKILADLASKSKCGDNYYILVIITDGVITDMEPTKKVLVEASSFPLSVIIIGVGEMEFDAMEELDGDSVRISFKGKQAERDIVQFVAYRSARIWMQNTGEKTVEESKQDDKIIVASATEGKPEGEQEEKPQKQLEILDPEEKRERAQRLLAQSQLAQEVLAEIPAQLTGYMKSKGITPTMIKKPAKLAAVFKKTPKIAALANVAAPKPKTASPTPTP